MNTFLIIYLISSIICLCAASYIKIFINKDTEISIGNLLFTILVCFIPPIAIYIIWLELDDRYEIKNKIEKIFNYKIKLKR